MFNWTPHIGEEHVWGLISFRCAMWVSWGALEFGQKADADYSVWFLDVEMNEWITVSDVIKVIIVDQVIWFGDFTVSA